MIEKESWEVIRDHILFAGEDPLFIAKEIYNHPAIIAASEKLDEVFLELHEVKTQRDSLLGLSIKCMSAVGTPDNVELVEKQLKESGAECVSTYVAAKYKAQVDEATKWYRLCQNARSNIKSYHHVMINLCNVIIEEVEDKDIRETASKLLNQLVEDINECS